MRYLVVSFSMLVVLGGCAQNRQYFRPTERVRGQTVSGYHEAFYDLVGPRGGFGEAKIWTVGAYRQGDNGVVEVTLDVHNTSGQPISISAKDLQLASVRTWKISIKAIPAAETGVFQVKPESHASVKVHFVLPPGMSPGEVSSFGFVWKVQNVDQTYTQATPFREEAAFYSSSSLYYSSMHPCFPHDLYCYGYWDAWPYTYYAAPLPPPYPVHEQRRRVDVNR